jgi:2-C-methyl-D-erythritol 4-phosphate cytidylyltransferase
MRVLVIIPAAGSGRRFGGGLPKQFQPLAGKPILQHVIERFLYFEVVTKIVVAVSDQLLAVVSQTPADRVVFVAGGQTRQESVTKAFEAAGDEFDLVAVHDAVRPFFRDGTFQAALQAAADSGAALPVLAVNDTIHVARDGFVTETLDRSNLVAAQTPQCFRYDVLRDVLDRGGREGQLATDEAGLAARLGVTVKTVPGDPNNIKITRPEDLQMAEAHFEEWTT